MRTAVWHAFPVTITILTASASAAAPAAQAAAPAETVTLWDAVAALPTAEEARSGYTRSSFRHWIDSDRDGCSTRAEVLIAEAVTPPEVGHGCTLNGGTWYSYYDDVTVAQASALDVDHVVALAESWDSGAHAWTPERREAYANDLDQAHHLVAVTARSNRSKADKDPAGWLPPHEPARCRYIAEWTAIKTRWQLSVDEQEKAALTMVARQCPNILLADASASAGP
ncbi:HNH endonuclease family protein [Nonomuraea polychroma]|uniref:HNH endonuclease family protein n=1 Tax=Nonomuraea polychroma TaxID=46176 RepID=UPI003D8B50FE